MGRVGQIELGGLGGYMEWKLLRYVFCPWQLNLLLPDNGFSVMYFAIHFSDNPYTDTTTPYPGN